MLDENDNDCRSPSHGKLSAAQKDWISRRVLNKKNVQSISLFLKNNTQAYSFPSARSLETSRAAEIVSQVNKVSSMHQTRPFG